MCDSGSDDSDYPTATTGIKMRVSGFGDQATVGEVYATWYVAFKGAQNNIG